MFQCSALAIVKFLTLLDQGALHFHFTLGLIMRSLVLRVAETRAHECSVSAACARLLRTGEEVGQRGRDLHTENEF